TYGVWVRRGCKDCRVQHNRLFDLGAGGVRVGEANMARTDAAETSRTLVDNNHIFDGGHVFAAGIGIWLAQSSSNRISHNDIHDLLYSGLSHGWKWGLETNRTHHNLVEFNHVHHLGHGVLSDAGLIYCLGVSPGSIIRNNVFHDMWPYSQPALGWGIYLDAQCGNYLVESNLVYNTLSGGLMFNNGGHEHVIRNNVFALSANQALWPYSEKRPSVFRRNIVYLTQGALFIPYGERSLNERLAAKEPPGDWDDNLYWHTGGPEQLRFYRRSFAEWQELGLDRHSRIADPQFRDVAAHDFRLQPGSPALELGFQPLDLSGAGLYGEPAWAGEVSHANCPHLPLPPPPPAPKPLTVNDGFEQTPVGAQPAQAHVSGEEKGASIRVSDERAASGRHSLKITDSKTLQPSWEPHFYYEPHFTQGVVQQSFDVWIGSNALFFTEWRDTATYPRNVGPSVSFDGAGKVSAVGKPLATVPSQSWVHVEIEAALGKSAPRTFRMTLTPAGSATQTFGDLPMTGAEFRELHWLGFSSTATSDAVYYLDNIGVKSLSAASASSAPAPDSALIDACQYADAAAAQAAWKPMGGTAAATITEMDGRKVLRLPCNFAGTKMERASWDRKVAWDLAPCRGIEFKVLCRDASPITHFSIYFQSGEGWYHASFFPEAATGWSTVMIDKAHTTSEGKPAGWGQIKTIRISAWRGKEADTEFLLGDIRKTGVGHCSW
ncbi:MAG: right-handed parallel beta-helix repeat-containing protein, partial [Verrucomicrobia bacterium]|nr:right-handed parallel beta-helix repeat-containing protein [Verrucomicrobiota bacterium]